MINLLSDQRKNDIRAARANVIILRYTAIIALALLFLGGALYASLNILKGIEASNEKIISSSSAVSGAGSDAQQQAGAQATELANAQATLDQEVRYSQLLVKLGQVMPAGTVLDALVLNTASFNGTPVELTVLATEAVDPASIKALFDSSPLFIPGSVSMKESETSTVSKYPVKIPFTVTFNKAGI